MAKVAQNRLRSRKTAFGDVRSASMVNGKPVHHCLAGLEAELQAREMLRILDKRQHHPPSGLQLCLPGRRHSIRACPKSICSVRAALQSSAWHVAPSTSLTTCENNDHSGTSTLGRPLQLALRSLASLAQEKFVKWHSHRIG